MTLMAFLCNIFAQFVFGKLFLRGLILCIVIASFSEAIQNLVFSFQFFLLDCFRLRLRNDNAQNHAVQSIICC
jgi:hypothetical protein